MNHHHRKILQAIFAHPVNANLDLKDVTNVLTGLGAEIDARTKSRIGITLNGQTTILHLTHHSLLKAEVMQIRKFLEFVRDFRRRLSGVVAPDEGGRNPQERRASGPRGGASRAAGAEAAIASGAPTQFSRNSPSTARNSAGLIRRAWATVTEWSRPSSSRVQKSRNFLSSGKCGCRSCCCQM